MTTTSDPKAELVPCSMRDFALYFLRLGTIGFGGPIALAGYVQRDLVDRSVFKLVKLTLANDKLIVGAGAFGLLLKSVTGP